MKLTIHNSVSFPPVAGSSLEIDSDVLGVDSAFKAESSVSVGYTDITSIANWNLYGWATSLDYRGIRNELIGFVNSWTTLTVPEKKILVSHFVYPVSTTQSELDGYWAKIERADQRHETREKLSSCDCLIMASKTINSEKFLLVGVDDAGIVTGVEIVSDKIL